MSPLRLAAIVGLFLTGQALGDSLITYELELGGDNHAANWEGQPVPTPFSAGSPADGQTYDKSADLITWDVTALVSGTHSTNSKLTNGAANLVFTLELHVGTAGGALASLSAEAYTPGPGGSACVGAGWCSTINDGDGDGIGGGVHGVDAHAKAAFAVAFDAKSLTPTPESKTARVIDEIGNNGPDLDYFTYPSAAGYPTGSTAAAGLLVGMGAGYSQYVPSGCPDPTYCDPGATTGKAAGVGLQAPGVFPQTPLGMGPVSEGQINASGLDASPAGTLYTLVLVANTLGNNILDGSFDPIVDFPGSFALRAEAVSTDEINFYLKGGAPSVTLTAAKSVKTHAAGVGDLAIDLDLAGTAGAGGTATREPRKGGCTKMVLTFSGSVTADCTAGVTVTNGSCVSVSGSGTAELTVTIGHVSAPANQGYQVDNAKYTTVAVSAANIQEGTVQVNVGNLFGNANDADKVINIVDLSNVKGQLFKPVTAANFRADVNIDGVISIVDLSDIKLNLFKQLP